MKYKSIGRALVCLLLVCCLITNIALLPVRATGFVESAIIGLSSVSVPGVLVVGATLVALGIMAYGAETGAWENLAYQATEFLEDTGEWIQDGSMEVMKAATAAGESIYYASGELFELLRNWAWEDGFVYNTIANVPASGVVHSGEQALAVAQGAAFYAVAVVNGEKFILRNNNNEFYYSSSLGHEYLQCGDYTTRFAYWRSSTGEWYSGQRLDITNGTFAIYTGKGLGYDTALELSLGQVPTFPIDGTSALEWSPDYARSQLRVINTGGGQDPDSGGNGWKWFLPLALAGTLTQIAGSTQEQQWTAETPEEFPEGSTVTEFEILDTPEIDGLPGLEVSPSTGSNPDSGSDPSTDPTTAPGTDPGTGTNPGTGTDSGSGTNPDSGSDTDSGTSDQNWEFYMLDLTDFFPFCIPFDLYAMLNAFRAEPVAPRWDFEFDFGELGSFPFTVDLSCWDDLAKIVRTFEVVLFCVGLAVGTKKLLGW